MQFSFANGLLRAAISPGFLLGFLGCLVAQKTHYSQATAGEPLIVTNEAAVGAYEASSSFCGSRFANLNNPSVPPTTVFAGRTYQGDALHFNCSDSILTEQVEMGLLDEDVVLEDDDSIEMLRVDIQQRTFGIDQVVIGPKVASKAARNTRPNTSLPLLV